MTVRKRIGRPPHPDKLVDLHVRIPERDQKRIARLAKREGAPFAETLRNLIGRALDG